MKFNPKDWLTPLARRIIKIILFYLLVASLMYYLYNFFVFIFLSEEAIPFQSAFFGAFCAAVFAILANEYIKYTEREWTAWTKLIFLDRELNKCMGIISDTRFQLKKPIENIKPKLPEDRNVTWYPLSFEKLEMNEEHLSFIKFDALRIGLSLIAQSFRKLNSDFPKIISNYDILILPHLQKGSLTPDEARIITAINNQHKELLITMDKALQKLDIDLLDCVAANRVIIRWDKPSLIKLFTNRFLGRYYDKNKFLEEKKKELEKLKEELKLIPKIREIKIEELQKLIEEIG